VQGNAPSPLGKSCFQNDWSLMRLLGISQSLDPCSFRQHTRTKAPSLHRHYPVSREICLPGWYYEPLRHPDTARPVTSRSAGWRAHASTAGASRVASVLRLHACPHHYPDRIDRDGSLAPLGGFPSRHRPSLDTRRVGSCIDCFEACSVFTRVRACLLAGSPKRSVTSEASAVSLPPRLLRLLPGGAIQFPGGTGTR